jgi:HEAT repeat protein
MQAKDRAEEVAKLLKDSDSDARSAAASALGRLVKNTKRPLPIFQQRIAITQFFELIQLRLKGKAGDESFLMSIIWSGGLRIVVDGLNEVTVETREKIRRFLDDFPKAHVLLTTQPMLRKRRPKARSVRLLPLSNDRILGFLESRYASFNAPVAINEKDYKAKCRAYLDDVLGPAQSEEEWAGARLVLSNPIDLTTAAQILVSGEPPTVKDLQAAVLHNER